MSKRYDYAVVLPQTPGATPTVVAKNLRLVEARAVAARAASSRRDLTYQDVRIERANGRLKEYAGPSR